MYQTYIPYVLLLRDHVFGRQTLDRIREVPTHSVYVERRGNTFYLNTVDDITLRMMM
jgi:hypothetical protein